MSLLIAACSRQNDAGVPARIEAVAGNAQSGAAGMDLPQPLVVRVTRVDGTGIADYPVAWTLQRGADSVSFEGRTDRHGFARAVWILANTTARQTAVARVAGLPVVTFAANATLHALPARRVTPARTTPPGIVVLDASTPAAAPGIFGSVPSRQRSQKLDSVSALPLPVLRGAIVAADGSNARVRIVVQSRTARDSIDVTAGPFAWPLLPSFQRTDVVDVRVQPLDQDTLRFYPALLHARAGALDSLRLALVPRVWTIASGAFRGMKVPIHVSLAFAEACARCASFYRRTAADSAGDWRATGDTWPGEGMQLGVDFAEGENRLSFADSAAFWKNVALFEKTLGRQVLTRESPATGQSMLQVGLDPAQGKVAETTTTAQAGRILSAQITFRRKGAVAGPLGTYLVQHEMMHVIGFGHTCAWHSVVADAHQCPTLQSDVLTPYDVAYLELFLAARAAESTGAALSLDGVARAEARHE